ncbi:MAG: hypothetical protein Tsb0021_05880 [Chlamydiales bacterium]
MPKDLDVVIFQINKMYIKALSHDDDIIFYFDGYDNKYVTKGGTLAWRTNNPGLVHSHSSSMPHSIGACGQTSIFSSPLQGEKTLNNWLHYKRYYHSNLIALRNITNPMILRIS